MLQSSRPLLCGASLSAGCRKAQDALEPKISKATMEYHWGKHYQTYVTNLNKQIEGKPLDSKSLEEVCSSHVLCHLTRPAHFAMECLKPACAAARAGHMEQRLADAGVQQRRPGVEPRVLLGGHLPQRRRCVPQHCPAVPKSTKQLP